SRSQVARPRRWRPMRWSRSRRAACRHGGIDGAPRPHPRAAQDAARTQKEEQAMTRLRATMVPRAFTGCAILCLALGGVAAGSPAAAQTVEEFLRALRPPSVASQPRNLEETSGPSPTPPVGFVEPSPAPVRPPLVNSSSTVCARTETTRIRFRFGSAELDENWIVNIQNLATTLNLPDMRGARIMLVGHTDGVGSDEYNLDLSRRRADAVRDYLVNRGGVAAGRISTDGRGRRQLARPDDPASGENRRVEIGTIC
ncbi:MAG: OmpA family protein, partial [Roseomonas sp.]|nr:OmpA family protein [Roseomonas sp.]